MLGFYLSDHPLTALREEIAKVATHAIANALEQGNGAEVRVVGIVGEVKKIATRSGKIMATVVLEDLSGRIECKLFPDAWEQAKDNVVGDAIVIASGRVEVSDDWGNQLLLSEIRPWEQARTQFRPALHIEMRAEDLTEQRVLDLDRVLTSYPGESEVYLYLVKPDHSRTAMRARKYRVEQADPLITRLKEHVPRSRVWWGKGAT